MSLMRVGSPLPTILKFSSVVLWPVMLEWSNIGDGAFRCSLNLSPNVLEDSYIFFITFHPITSVSVYDATLLDYVVFIFGCHQEVFDGPALWSILEYHISYIFFYTLTEAFHVRNHYVVFLMLEMLLILVSFFLLLLLSFGIMGALIFFFILFKAHSGYLLLVRTFCRCSCSSCKCCRLEQTALALWYSVLITLSFADMACGYPTANIGQCG